MKHGSASTQTPPRKCIATNSLTITGGATLSTKESVFVFWARTNISRGMPSRTQSAILLQNRFRSWRYRCALAVARHYSCFRSNSDSDEVEHRILFGDFLFFVRRACSMVGIEASYQAAADCMAPHIATQRGQSGFLTVFEFAVALAKWRQIVQAASYNLRSDPRTRAHVGRLCDLVRLLDERWCAAMMNRERSYPMTEILCPITMQPFVDPVVCCDGHTYERRAIESWFTINEKKTSPMTGMTISSLLIPNIALRHVMEHLSCSTNSHKNM